jgi:hypothetical protein
MSNKMNASSVKTFEIIWTLGHSSVGFLNIGIALSLMG